MEKIKVGKTLYEIISNDNNCLNIEELLSKMTDYFDDFDYVFGDYAYDKLRLKGFYDSNNKKVKEINDIKYLEEYKKDYCSYGASNFLIKKVK